jgi:hypothetical protein
MGFDTACRPTWRNPAGLALNLLTGQQHSQICFSTRAQTCLYVHVVLQVCAVPGAGVYSPGSRGFGPAAHCGGHCRCAGVCCQQACGSGPHMGAAWAVAGGLCSRPRLCRACQEEPAAGVGAPGEVSVRAVLLLLQPEPLKDLCMCCCRRALLAAGSSATMGYVAMGLWGYGASGVWACVLAGLHPCGWCCCAHCDDSDVDCCGGAGELLRGPPTAATCGSQVGKCHGGCAGAGVHFGFSSLQPLQNPGH